MDLGSLSRRALALLPVCVPTASAVARAAARAPRRSHPEIQPYHSGRSRAELGPGLDASTPVRRALAKNILLCLELGRLAATTAAGLRDRTPAPPLLVLFFY